MEEKDTRAILNTEKDETKENKSAAFKAGVAGVAAVGAAAGFATVSNMLNDETEAEDELVDADDVDIENGIAAAEENDVATEESVHEAEAEESSVEFTPEPEAEEPAAEESIVEEPAAEVVTEPETETPVAEEPIEVEPAAEETVAEEPVAEESAAEEPVADVSEPTEPIAEDPVNEEISESVVASEEMPTIEEPEPEVVEEPEVEDVVEPEIPVEVEPGYEPFDRDYADHVVAEEVDTATAESEVFIAGEFIDPGDSEVETEKMIHFIGDLQTVYNDDGTTSSAIDVMDAEGNNMLMVDIDGDHKFDLMIDDENHINYDITEWNLTEGDALVDSDMADMGYLEGSDDEGFGLDIDLENNIIDPSSMA